MNAHTGFPLPDLTTSLPRAPFLFGPKAVEEATAVLDGAPAGVFRQLLGDQESETTLLVARHVLEAFLGNAAAGAHATDPATTDPAGPAAPQGTDADAVAAYVQEARAALVPSLTALREAGPGTHRLVLRRRAPLTLLGGCWLDTVSQAATQPSVIVNRLFGQYFLLRGAGTPQRGLLARRRRTLDDLGVHLPGIEAADFLQQAGARPLTALHAAFFLALSRLPASFLPEVVGVHYAMSALGVDDVLLGTEPLLPEAAARTVLAEYLALTEQSPTGAEDRRRTRTAIELVLRLEREQTALLTELADWHDGLSLDARVAQIVARHAPFAGKQHRGVRMGGRRLSEWLGDEELDLAEFVAVFREARQTRTGADGVCRFLQSIKFGGPMFGIFDEEEAATFTAWTESIAAGEPADLDFRPDTSGDERAAEWTGALRSAAPADVVAAEPERGLDDRELFHRIVNVERYPHILPVARDRAEAGLADAELLFTHGGGGKLTNAEYFDYTPEALMERVERIYWDKLVNPYRPLTEIPDRDEVVFGQSTFALGSLIDGSWAHRIGNLGRDHRQSDHMLFAIYADEMGRGDLAKNHITLIHQVLASMDIHLPHIRQQEFLDQGDLPDGLYGFSVHQVCLSLFPDTLYNEILGYNLGIEMFGLGEMRLHEIQKLRRHNFDVSYEEAHLSIDNFSAGHARQSADIIVSYLDDVRRASGEEAVQREWRRIWRGYASFAYFVEHQLVKQVTDRQAAAAPAARPDDADLVI